MFSDECRPLTVREEFAKAAMAAILAHGFEATTMAGKAEIRHQLALEAWAMADAMLAAQEAVPGAGGNRGKVMSLRTITLDLDELDFNAVQNAMARRQNFGQGGDPAYRGLMPDSDSNPAGALVAEICRGWMEMLDAAKRRR